MRNRHKERKQDIADGVIPSGGIQLSIHEVQGETGIIPAGEVGQARASCPDGELMTGGGFAGQPFFLDFKIITNAEDQGTWLVSATNDDISGEIESLLPFAYCLDLTP